MTVHRWLQPPPGALVWLVAAGLWLWPSAAAAQPAVQRFERQLEQISRDTLLLANPALTPDQRLWFDAGGYLTLDYLTVDDNVNNNHVLRQSQAIGYMRLNLDGAHEALVRGIAGWRDFNEGDSFDGRGDERIDPDFDRAYYRYDLRRARAAYHGQQISGNLVVRGGRDLVYWGNGLVLNEVVDGLWVDGMWGNGWSATAVAGVTPVRTVDFDPSRPDFDFNTRRGFYGGMIGKTFRRHRPYVYGLLQRDYNDDETLDVPVFGSGTIQTEFEYNSHYLGAGIGGPIGDRMLYSAEVVYEGGESLSNSFTLVGNAVAPIDQTTDDISAYAADVRLDYLVPDRRNTRFSGEVILASGDDDRLNTSSTFGGNAPGTDDQAFNAFGLLNTGLAFAPTVSNLISGRVGASTFPMPDTGPLRFMQAGVDVFVYGKFESDAPINERTDDERYLGWEPDLFVNWAVTSDVTLSLRYGLFFPSSSFPSDETREFFFAGLTYGF